MPEILDPSMLDAKYLVSNRDAIAALRDLVDREGIFGGPSCGAVLVAAAREAQRMERGTIVALLPDGGWKYLCAGHVHAATSTRWRTTSRAASAGGERPPTRVPAIRPDLDPARTLGRGARRARPGRATRTRPAG